MVIFERSLVLLASPVLHTLSYRPLLTQLNPSSSVIPLYVYQRSLSPLPWTALLRACWSCLDVYGYSKWNIHYENWKLMSLDERKHVPFVLLDLNGLTWSDCFQLQAPNFRILWFHLKQVNKVPLWACTTFHYPFISWISRLFPFPGYQSINEHGWASISRAGLSGVL